MRCHVRGTRAPDRPRPGAARLAWALLGVLLLVTTSPLAAQEMVRAVGVVQWISGARMQMVSGDGFSVAIDLTQADQSSYRGLRNGDWVVVDGTLTADGRVLVARDIWRDDGRGAWTQSP